jgi:CHAT domain-containing protein
LFKLTFYIVLIFSIESVYSQDWNQLENEYNDLLKNNQEYLTLNKAKELYNWVIVHESDTSIHLPISLKYIDNTYKNSDSTINDSLRSAWIECVYKNDLKKAKRIATILINKAKLNFKTQPSVFFESTLILGETYYYMDSLNCAIKYLTASKKGMDSLNIIFSNKYYPTILRFAGHSYSELKDFYLAEKSYLNCIENSLKNKYIDSVSYIECLSNLATLYHNNDLFQKAIPLYNTLIDISIKLNGDKSVELALLLDCVASSNTQINNFLQAHIHLNKSLKIKSELLGIKSDEYCHTLIKMGLLYWNEQKKDSAEIFFKKVKLLHDQFINKNNPDYILNLNSLGYLYFEKGKYKESESYFKKALKHIDKYDSYGMKLTLQANLAYTYSEQKRYLLADSIFKIIFQKEVERIPNLFSSLKEKEYHDYWQDGYYDYFERVIKYTVIGFEKFRSLSLNVYNIILFYKAFLLEVTLNKKNTNTQLNSENFSINEAAVKGKLLNDEAAIEFVEYSDNKDSSKYYLALIVKLGVKYPQLVKICKENELKQYSPEAELKDIYDLVWKPLSPYLNGIKTIYYSPAGLLNNIPFQALYKEENGQREYLMDKFTLHQLTSTRYLALDLKKKEQEPIDNSIALFGGINYNDYPNAVIDTSTIEESSEAAFLYKNTITVNRDLDSTRAGASYLPGTKTEVNTIAQLLKNNYWSVDMADGKNASENKIKSYSGNNSKSILHIATHGFAYPDKEVKKQEMALRMMQGNERYKVADNPMIRSGLLFGGANLTWKGKGDSLLNKTNEDGVLTAYELSQLDLSDTKLAVLSACETGKGAIQGSEGTFGLKRALKLAGVDNMIVSLWKVPDEATSEMMTIFYTELAHTKLPVQSFEKAQKQMRDKYPDEPKKWAGFVYVR